MPITLDANVQVAQPRHSEMASFLGLSLACMVLIGEQEVGTHKSVRTQSEGRHTGEGVVPEGLGDEDIASLLGVHTTCGIARQCRPAAQGPPHEQATTGSSGSSQAPREHHHCHIPPSQLRSPLPLTLLSRSSDAALKGGPWRHRQT